jgi:hypothetical protein
MGRAGHLPLTQLSLVALGCPLLNPVAQAFKNMALVARLYDGTVVKPVSTYGSGYRDWDTALTFYRAGQGDKAALAKCGIDPRMRVSIAYPPGSHGDGTRIDALWNGHSPNPENLQLAQRYGFRQEFGDADRNHLAHDKRTAVSGVRGYDKIRLTARMLNERHLGRTTNAANTGRRDPDFIWLIQHYGHLIKFYPAHCKEDGITGGNTERTFDHVWNILKAS